MKYSEIQYFDGKKIIHFLGQICWLDHYDVVCTRHFVKGNNTGKYGTRKLFKQFIPSKQGTWYDMSVIQSGMEHYEGKS